jgi:hypothetical protein
MRTIATDPQQGTIFLPILECVALGKPGGSSIVLTITCDVMIYGRIRSSKPRPKLLSGLVPWGSVSASVVESGIIQELLTPLLIHSCSWKQAGN